MFQDEAAPVAGKNEVPREETPQSLGLPVEPRRLALAVWAARRRLTSVVLALGLVGALAGKFVMPKSYLASATLLWQPPLTARSDAVREVSTLAQSVKVPVNLLRVRERLRLTTRIETLARDIEVTQGENSHLLAVSARASSRQESADLAQAVVDVFLDAQREQAQEKLQETVAALQQSLQQAQRDAGQARERYDAFRSEHHVDDFSVDVQTAISESARLRVAAGDAAVELRGLEARLQALRSARSSFSERVEISRNELNEDRARLGHLESELAGLRSRLTDDHPRVKSAAAEVDALKGRVDSVNPTVVGQVVGRNPVRDALVMQVEESSALHRAVAERARALADLRTAAEQRAGLLTQVQGEAARLLAEVQADESHVALLLKQLSMAEDDVRSATSGFQVLSRPLPPERSEKGLGRVVALVVPALALVFGVLFFLFRELKSGMVCAPSEVAYWLRAPVLWGSAWPTGGPPTVLIREVADALEGHAGLIGIVGLGGAPSREFVDLVAARLTARSQPVSIWDARDAQVVGEDASPEACEDPKVARKLRARVDRGHLVLVTGLDGVENEQLRALSRWFDGLLVVVTSERVRALSLRELAAALPRMAGKTAAVVVAAREGLGPRDVRGPRWLPVPLARSVQPSPAWKSPRKRTHGASP